MRDERFVIDYGISAAFFESLHGILVAIERGTFQCKKDGALGTPPAVCRHSRVGEVQRIKVFCVDVHVRLHLVLSFSGSFPMVWKTKLQHFFYFVCPSAK